MPTTPRPCAEVWADYKEINVKNREIPTGVSRFLQYEKEDMRRSAYLPDSHMYFDILRQNGGGKITAVYPDRNPEENQL
jgi:hypothetical protein